MILVSDDILSVKMQSHSQPENLIYTEGSIETFVKQIDLRGKVNTGDILAGYNENILRITLPKQKNQRSPIV